MFVKRLVKVDEEVKIWESLLVPLSMAVTNLGLDFGLHWSTLSYSVLLNRL